MDEFRIGERILSPDRLPYVIAEVGLNHNGDLGVAKATVDMAAACGVDAVKFQSFRAEEFIADREMTYSYKSSGGSVAENAFAMFKRLELPLAWHSELMNYCASKGLDFLSSVADALCADLLNELKVGAIKIASEDLINQRLLRHVGAIGLPVILSTGMADKREVDEGLETLKLAGCKEVMLLHCVSLYPTPDEEVNLRRMVGLRERYQLPIGYSDHSLGIAASIGAVALGALAIEKHFTLDAMMTGPDHALSSDPAEMRMLVHEAHRAWRMLGAQKIAPAPREVASRQAFRRSIALARDVAVGTVLQPEFLCLKRPATGLHPRHLDDVVGRRARKTLKADNPLRWEDLE